MGPGEYRLAYRVDLGLVALVPLTATSFWGRMTHGLVSVKPRGSFELGEYSPQVLADGLRGQLYAPLEDTS